VPSNFSTYLDLFRFLAAMTVMVAHLTFPKFAGQLISYQGEYAGAAVTAFFVLSGYVIAYVSAEKETDWRSYAVSRMARIYSVALPALALTILLDWLGYFLGSPKALPLYQYQQLWKYLPIFLTFTSEVGPLRENVLSDGVFWSLSYEVWYYIVFAVAFYMSGWKRNVLLLILAAGLGSRVLIMFPLWLAGVGIYYLHRSIQIPETKARVLFMASILGLVATRYFGVDVVLDDFTNKVCDRCLDGLRNSMHFPGHYVIGGLFALNILSARYCNFNVLNKARVKRTIQYCAGFTFAIYLMHIPLRDFFAFIYDHQPGSISGLITLFLTMLLGTWVLGQISERKKDWWREIFRKVVGESENKPVPAKQPI